MKTDGDCFYITGQAILDNIYKNPILVHGEVLGQGEVVGIRFAHAWIELDGKVIDKSNGNNISVDKDLYYRIGDIDDVKGKLYKYTSKEAKILMLKNCHYGPWDLRTQL